MGQNRPVKATSIHAEVQQWSGPMPAPESLAKYEDIIPGSAERILVMAEKEQGHRHDMEEKTSKRQLWLAIFSTFCAFVSILSLIALVVYAIYAESYNSALATIIGAIAAVAGVFSIGKFLKSKEK
jgi:uncharacterized membrane protein